MCRPLGHAVPLLDSELWTNSQSKQKKLDLNLNRYRNENVNLSETHKKNNQKISKDVPSANYSKKNLQQNKQVILGLDIAQNS